MSEYFGSDQATAMYVVFHEDGGVEAGLVQEDGWALVVKLGPTETEKTASSMRAVGENSITLRRVSAAGAPMRVERRATYLGVNLGVSIHTLDRNRVGKKNWLGGD